jgi:hypothetical protein
MGRIRIGACGCACEVCELYIKKGCPGCAAGTDKDAPEKLKEFKDLNMPSCKVFECAIRNKMEYCISCKEFPCKVHYKEEFPYSKKALDMAKDSLKPYHKR